MGETSFGWPTGQEGVAGPSGRGWEHAWSHGSEPPAPQGMLSSHCTLSPCQEPNAALARAALSPGTLVLGPVSSLSQHRLCAAAVLALSPSAPGSQPFPLPACSLQPKGRKKAMWRLLGKEERIYQYKPENPLWECTAALWDVPAHTDRAAGAASSLNEGCFASSQLQDGASLSISITPSSHLPAAADAQPGLAGM